jgi:hypothetical protein
MKREMNPIRIVDRLGMDFLPTYVACDGFSRSGAGQQH